MKLKKTDSILKFDFKVSIHRRGKKADARDKRLASHLEEKTKGLFISLLEYYANRGQADTVKAVEYEKGNYYLGEPR